MASSQYPYPSTLNVSNFVSIKLSKSNYKLWKTQMLCLIESQYMLGFVDGTIIPPNEEYQQWIGSDRLLKGWILGSLSEDVLDLVADQNTARDVWKKLGTIFGPNLGAGKAGDGVRHKLMCLRRYLPLYEAALRGDWEAAKSFFDHDKDAVVAKITPSFETALHVAIEAGEKAVRFVEKLLELMPKEALALTNIIGYTALAYAAYLGNTAGATMMVNKFPDLVYIPTDNGNLPLHLAALCGKKDTVSYLLNVTKDNVQHSPFQGKSGSVLLKYLVDSDCIGMALDLLKRYPHLAIVMEDDDDFDLEMLGRKASAFQSGSRFNYLESLIYSCVPIKLENYSNNPNGSDIENLADNSKVLKHMGGMVSSAGRNCFSSVCQRLHLVLWEVASLLVPHIKHIEEKKVAHYQAVELVRFFCKEIKSSSDEKKYKFHQLINALHLAARWDIPEVVEEVVHTFPDAIWISDHNNHRIIQLAVIYRCEKVFNLFYQLNTRKQFLIRRPDSLGNNILHLAGRLAPIHKLNRVSGAALQMQRELQWFKEVEKLVEPRYKHKMNTSNETPAMVFTNEHKDLVVAGEKWMKVTANSCSFTATLIATVAFAAAFTVPGGNNNENSDLRPVFSKSNFIIIFMASDAISLFASTTSLLMFLSILTARYAEEDFHYVLPKRLILGLITLFLSITSMMITFCAALYLVFGQQRAWILFPMASLACLPVTSFVTLQFPLLIGLISSTFGPGIFGKQSNRQFY